MANLIKNKFIGTNEVDGRNILLQNAQFIRAKKADGSIVSLFNLDANDKLSFSQVPVIASGAESSDPQALQTSGQVESTVTDAVAPVIASVTTEAGRITQEIADRIAADGALDDRIDTEAGRISGEIAARGAADTALGGRIDTEAARITAEISARTTEVTRLDGRIDSEALQLDTEIANRATEVTRLDGRIDTNEGRIDDEVSDRTAGDTALGLRIDGEAATRLSADNALGVRIDDEASARAAAVSTVDGRVTTEVTRLDGRIDDLAAQVSGDIDQRLDEETAARIAADNALGVRIDGVESDVATLTTTVTTEVTRIDGEITRIDGEIDDEVAARAAGDLALNGRVDGVESDLADEVSARTSGDAANAAAIATQTGRIDTEVTRLDGEIANRIAADTALGGRIDGVETDLANESARALAAEALLIPLAQKGAAGGVVPLDENTLIPLQFIPNSLVDVLEFPDLASFPATGMGGTIYVDLATNRTYRWSGSVYSEVSPSAVTSVNGKADAVVLDTSDIAEGINLYYTDARVEAYVRPIIDDVADTVGDHETRIAYLEQFPKPVWDNYKRTLSGADITAGSFTLPFVPLPNSVIASVDRLMMYEGEDFILVNNAGVYTFQLAGDMVDNGSQKLVAGDNIYIKYQREYTEPV